MHTSNRKELQMSGAEEAIQDWSGKLGLEHYS